MWKYKIDKMWVGVVAGIFLPCVIFALIYLKNYSETPLAEFMKHAAVIGIMPVLLSLSLIVNLAVFFMLYLWKFEMVPRGMILATFIWGMAIIYFKFLY